LGASINQTAAFFHANGNLPREKVKMTKLIEIVIKPPCFAIRPFLLLPLRRIVLLFGVTKRDWRLSSTPVEIWM
jgi:hypothetical protein